MEQPFQRGAWHGASGLRLTQLHRVVLFSNTNAAHVAHIKANYQVFGHVHAAYLSHELGLVKPDAASFLKLLEIEGLPPVDCIFLDDRAENPAAAAALGMRTVTFSGRDAFLADLDRYGVTLESFQFVKKRLPLRRKTVRAKLAK